MKPSVLEIIAWIIGAAVCCVVLILLCAWPFMWLWNYAVVSAITVARPIGYRVAVGLLIFMAAFFRSSSLRRRASEDV